MSMMMWSLWEPAEAALVHVEVGVLGGGEEDVDGADDAPQGWEAWRKGLGRPRPRTRRGLNHGPPVTEAVHRG